VTSLVTDKPAIDGNFKTSERRVAGLVGFKHTHDAMRGLLDRIHCPSEEASQFLQRSFPEGFLITAMVLKRVIVLA
jgi:hypothetical protein